MKVAWVVKRGNEYLANDWTNRYSPNVEKAILYETRHDAYLDRHHNEKVVKVGLTIEEVK